jgi:hypothetical protein
MGAKKTECGSLFHKFPGGNSLHYVSPSSPSLGIDGNNFSKNDPAMWIDKPAKPMCVFWREM